MVFLFMAGPPKGKTLGETSTFLIKMAGPTRFELAISRSTILHVNQATPRARKYVWRNRMGNVGFEPTTP